MILDRSRYTICISSYVRYAIIEFHAVCTIFPNISLFGREIESIRANNRARYIESERGVQKSTNKYSIVFSRPFFLWYVDQHSRWLGILATEIVYVRSIFQPVSLLPPMSRGKIRRFKIFKRNYSSIGCLWRIINFPSLLRKYTCSIGITSQYKRKWKLNRRFHSQFATELNTNCTVNMIVIHSLVFVKFSRKLLYFNINNSGYSGLCDEQKVMVCWSRRMKFQWVFRAIFLMVIILLFVYLIWIFWNFFRNCTSAKLRTT